MKCHQVSHIGFEKNKLTIKIDGKIYHFSLTSISPKLAKASEQERLKYVISPSGYGIHWPLLDEDISIDGLLKTRLNRRKSEFEVSH